MQLPLRVLFLCTGNSCRSIIAEAVANHAGHGRLIAHSAGSHPAGEVNPRALAVLARHHVPVKDPVSESWEAYEDVPVDLVITVCDAAAGEACPLWMGNTLKAHWGLADPAKVAGDAAAVDRAFELTYHQMLGRIESMLALPLASMTPAELIAALGDIQRNAPHSEFVAPQ